MARVPVLNDGQPLTYELINKIIEKLASIKEPSEDQSQNVEIFGPNIGQTSKDTVRIFCGSSSITMNANSVSQNFTIEFKNNKNKGGSTIFTKPPVVVATIVDTQKDDGVDMAVYTIIEQSPKDFKVKIQMIKKRDKAVTLRLNYIAIGAGPSNT